MLTGGHNVASENIQSRLRGLIVMAHANSQEEWQLQQEINQN